jgi:hypothetical protein
MWIPDGGEVPTRPGQTIASPKQMLTVFWSPLGLSLAEILPKGIRFGFYYSCFNILSAIVQNRPSETAEDWRPRMVLHFDNATCQTDKYTIDYLRANQLTHAPYPAFSPDLALSDFDLFGTLKMALMG